MVVLDEEAAVMVHAVHLSVLSPTTSEELLFADQGRRTCELEALIQGLLWEGYTWILPSLAVCQRHHLCWRSAVLLHLHLSACAWSSISSALHPQPPHLYLPPIWVPFSNCAAGWSPIKTLRVSYTLIPLVVTTGSADLLDHADNSVWKHCCLVFSGWSM